MSLPTTGGDEVEIGPNHKMTFKPTYEKTSDGMSTRIHIRARSMDEMLERIKDVKRDHPRLDLTEMIRKVEVKQIYLNDLMTCQLDFGGPASDRSMVKTAVALAFDAGIPPGGCDLAMEYLKNEDAERCFYPYYGNSIVKDRNSEVPLHCVYVTGSPKSGTILGYVEFYGVVRRVVILSRAYKGMEFSNLYAIDPISGEKQDIIIELDESTIDVAEAQTYDMTISGMTEAVKCVLDAGQASARSRELEKVIKAGWEKWFYDSGKKEGDKMTKEDARIFTDYIMRSSTPFLLHILEQTAMPCNDPQLDA